MLALKGGNDGSCVQTGLAPLLAFVIIDAWSNRLRSNRPKSSLRRGMSKWWTFASRTSGRRVICRARGTCRFGSSDAKAALVRDGLVFVCAAGIRSQAAARIAESYGLTRVFNLTGGTQSWARAGFPLIRERTAA
jgi:hypothetical protein